MRTSFQRLEAPLPLHKTVQERIRAYIVQHRLRAGDPLISESELARQFGVSRGAVREAVKALESMGVLETRRGSGVFVSTFSFEALFDNLPYGLIEDVRHLRELAELRRILEVALVPQTLSLITPQILEKLRDTLDRMRVRIHQNETPNEEDREFHQLIFTDLGNEMLLRLFDVFWLAVRNVRAQMHADEPDLNRIYRAHLAIVEALESKDIAATQTAINNHYTGSFETFEQAQHRLGEPSGSDLSS